MNIEKHITEFLDALNGGRGTLDAWLKCKNEAECRIAILGAIAAEREACRQVVEECIRTQAHLASNPREALSEASARIYKRSN